MPPTVSYATEKEKTLLDVDALGEADRPRRWAWQNTYLTRHLPKNERERRATTRNSKRRRPVRSLSVTLSDLHLLLRVKSFERWPLHVRFFAQDVYKAWKTLEDRLSSGLRDGITVTYTPSEPIITDHGMEIGPDQARGIGSLDIGYGSMKPMLEKSLATFAPAAPKQQCTKCKDGIDSRKALTLVCPGDACKGVWHVGCLSQELLAQGGCQDMLVPIKGSCPSCGTKLEWSMLMKELSLRTRGQKTVARLFKQKPVKKGDIQSDASSALTATLEALDTPGQDLDDVGDEEDARRVSATFTIPQCLAEELGDDWVLRTNDEDDFSSITSNLSPRQSPCKPETGKKALAPIVEDSDCADDAEMGEIDPL